MNWSLGWTVPHVDPGTKSWRFVGETDGVWVDQRGKSDPSTEVVFLLPINHPAALIVASAMSSTVPGRRRCREHTLKTLGSMVRFRYEPSSGHLYVHTSHAAELPPSYTENWIGEPFRILLGQLIFPRLTARNFEDRQSISIRRSPGLIGGAARLATLWQQNDLNARQEEFWSLYDQLLTIIARARGFEAHKITQLYEEIIQAARSTRWIWAMTFASCVEALVNILEPPGRLRLDSDGDAADSLASHISLWSGDASLKKTAIKAIRQSTKTTAAIAIRDLHRSDVVTGQQVKAWNDIRHRVMHGNLISMCSSKEENDKLILMSEMAHSLTLKILRRSTARPEV